MISFVVNSRAGVVTAGGVGPIVLDHYSLSKLVGRSPRSRALNLRLRSSSRRLLHRETYLNLNKNCEPLLVGFNLFCCRSIWDSCSGILCNCLSLIQHLVLWHRKKQLLKQIKLKKNRVVLIMVKYKSRDLFVVLNCFFFKL